MAEHGENDKNLWQRARQVFDQVTRVPAAERLDKLAELSDGDEALFAFVKKLLDSASDSIVEEVIGQAALDLAPERAAETLGPYRIERLIGEGGMGDVYLAKRADGAFSQRVAIKILGARRPHKDLVRRFEAERQILANLNHPNIASLIDGGETSDGLPYLVMEYVDGRPIHRYCDEEQLDVHQRLELFLKVLGAIDHAHRQLIVHRDIKPSNIFVNDAGEPKLLDFGIAKLLDPELSDRTLVETVDSMRMLTPRHASPEQLRGETVTVASDIYSLGVLLYELLSGLFPYQFASNRSADIENVICDTDPSKPSVRLAQTIASEPEAAAEIAAARQLRLNELSKLMGGDLDNIVLTAMQKAVDRRYATVRDLAADVSAFLTHRPVAARADSLVYRASKFLRRNRAIASISTAAFLFVSTATVLAFNQVAEQRDAAETERARAEAVSGFLQGIFEVSDPDESMGEAISARDILEEGSRRIGSELADQPATRATMLRVLGEVYNKLGDTRSAGDQLDQSIDLLRQLGAAEQDELATALLVRGIIHQDRSEFDEAKPYIDESVSLREAIHGRNSFEVAEVYNVKAHFLEMIGELDDAEVLYRESLEINRRLADGDHVYVAESMTTLAGLHRTRGRHDQAEPLLRDAIAMLDRLYGHDNLEQAQSERQLAGLLRDTGRFEESQALYKKVIATRQRMLGEEHIEVAHVWNSYSQLLDEMGDLDGAIEAHERFLTTLEKATDGPHASYGAAYNNYGFLLQRQGSFDEAIRYFNLSIDMQDEIGLSPRHPNRSFPLQGLGVALNEKAEFEDALPVLEDALSIRREHFGENHRFTLQTKYEVGVSLTGLNRYPEAETLLVDAYANLASLRGETHRETLLAANRLVELYEKWGQPLTAEEWQRTIRAAEAQRESDTE
ncbi:MAG: serine/threonine-protein kinase [Woeseiaceae bacterium]|nr:serine/threonine-protein kinase [Woeseiaceae bacterium]